MVVTPGETGKLAPEALVPKATPPDADVYHAMVLPDEIALSCAVAPGHIVEGVAITEVGAEGTGLTVMTDGSRVPFSQPVEVL